MRFFYANPPGRILNRFSKDLDEGCIAVMLYEELFIRCTTTVLLIM